MNDIQRGHFLKEWRTSMKMNQAEFATYVGLSASNYHYLEAGKIGYTQKSLETIARALEVTPADLLSRNPLEAAPLSGDPEMDEFYEVIEILNSDHLEILIGIAHMFHRRQQKRLFRGPISRSTSTEGKS